MSITRKLVFLGGIGLLLFGTVSFSSTLSSQAEGQEVSIGTFHTLPSKILNEERTLLIHLPRDYQSTTLDYPVLFLLYGNHVTTYFAEAVSILDRLGPTARIPDMLLVAVTNTDRYRDLLPQTPDGRPTGIDNFVRFFKEELIPYVETHYRAKDYRILMGPQAGANFGMYVLFEHPDLFQAAILDNPFRWQGGRDLTFQNAHDTLQNQSRFPKFLSITYEDGDELAKEGGAYVDRFAALVRKRNVPEFRLHLNFIANNDEFIQPMGLRAGLKALFQDYPFPENKEVGALDDILAFYQDLSSSYGFAVDAPEHVLSMQTYEILEKGKLSEALKAVDFIQKTYPHSANAYMILATIHQRSGELEKELRAYREMIEILPGDTGMIARRIAALERRIDSSAAYALDKEIRTQGLEAGLLSFRSIQKESEGTYYFEEREFNELGYRLLGQKEMEAAIRIFKLNVEMFPDSANVYDSLAEAYMKNGQKDEAIRNYEKSLELDPDNQNAKDKLKKLRIIRSAGH